MTSFEDLNLDPEVIEALAAEGIEVPTPFQAAAIPVIARGNDLLGYAGPGAGTLIGYAAGLLGRIEGGQGSPEVIVLTTGARQARDLARSLAGVASACGVRVAAMDGRWNLPQLADFLFVPAEAITALFDGTVELGLVKAVVVHDGDGLLRTTPRDRLDSLYGEWPAETQRIICGQPFGPDLATFASGHTKRAVSVPAQRVDDARSRKTPSKGSVEVYVVEESREDTALTALIEVLEEPIRHVVVHTASSDQAADLGDFLTLHGFHCGPVGDKEKPVWLRVEGEPAADLREFRGKVATLSYAVPPGSQALSERHPDEVPASAIAEIRELGHLKQIASEVGRTITRQRPPRPIRVSTHIDELGSRLAELITSPGLTPYYLLVEALADRFTPSEIAAAALYQLDEASAKPNRTQKPEAEPWVRLFITAGTRDEVGPGELLGAITGESGVAGSRIGRIDVRDNHALVEVRQEDAQRIIDALNGTTLGGRAVRVDYDRARERKGAPKKGPRRKPVRG